MTDGFVVSAFQEEQFLRSIHNFSGRSTHNVPHVDSLRIDSMTDIYNIYTVRVYISNVHTKYSKNTVHKHTASVTLRGFLFIAQGHTATPLWEMALLTSPLLYGERVCKTYALHLHYSTLSFAQKSSEQLKDTFLNILVFYI